MEEYLTVQQVAQSLGLAEQTVRNALSRGRLPYVQRYGRNLISRQDLESYRQRTQPGGVKRPYGRPKKSLASPEDSLKKG